MISHSSRRWRFDERISCDARMVTPPRLSDPFLERSRDFESHKIPCPLTRTQLVPVAIIGKVGRQLTQVPTHASASLRKCLRWDVRFLLPPQPGVGLPCHIVPWFPQHRSLATEEVACSAWLLEVVEDLVGEKLETKLCRNLPRSGLGEGEGLKPEIVRAVLAELVRGR